jgi:hypothetical protein
MIQPRSSFVVLQQPSPLSSFSTTEMCSWWCLCVQSRGRGGSCQWCGTGFNRQSVGSMCWLEQDFKSHQHKHWCTLMKVCEVGSWEHQLTPGEELPCKGQQGESRHTGSFQCNWKTIQGGTQAWCVLYDGKHLAILIRRRSLGKQSNSWGGAY